MAGPAALLTLVTGRGANLALVHLEARRSVHRLVPLLADAVPAAAQPRAPDRLDSAAPLARRTPMATLPHGVRPRQAVG